MCGMRCNTHATGATAQRGLATQACCPRHPGSAANHQNVSKVPFVRATNPARQRFCQQVVVYSSTQHLDTGTNLITDVGVAVHLMEAALSSARLNVLINTRLISDSNFVIRCNSETIEILKQFAAQKNSCLAPVEQKLHKS